MSCDMGLIGLAVMGQNLALNAADHGFKINVYNRTKSKTDAFMQGEASKKDIQASFDLKQLVSQLKRPRKILLMVQAGPAVDKVIDDLMPLLDEGDIIIDGGNSHFEDTERRMQKLENAGFLFIGTGISGGEEGARHGPAIMPGGHFQAWQHVQPLFQAIAAKTLDGFPCCDWVGSGGAGHFVKMVHNGIEYGDMELIAEAYHILHRVKKGDANAISDTFKTWNEGKLNSYLIEITAKITQKKDEDGALLLDHILDVAQQKGTGLWTSINALNLKVPLTLISEAVFARYLSGLKEERVRAHALFKSEETHPDLKEQEIENALYASKIISYAQGFSLMRLAATHFGWTIDYGKVALLWRAGCIIRSRFLDNIEKAFTRDKDLPNLLLDPFFQKAIKDAEKAWRKTISQAALHGIPIPGLASALSFFDGFRSANLPANLIQAQRDYFGAHTYERTDRPRGEFFHTEWI